MPRAHPPSRHPDAPGRHVRRRPGRRPLRLVLGVLAVLVLALGGSLLPVAALAEDGGSDLGDPADVAESNAAGGDPEHADPYSPGDNTEHHATQPEVEPGPDPIQHEVMPPGPPGATLNAGGKPGPPTMPGPAGRDVTPNPFQGLMEGGPGGGDPKDRYTPTQDE
jgi:hypothetical protein